MAFTSEKEIGQLHNRLLDLANQSYKQNVYKFSGFLGLAELSATMSTVINSVGLFKN